MSRTLGASVVRADGTRKPRNLTPGEFQYGGVSWLADSSGVVTTGAGFLLAVLWFEPEAGA